MAGDTPGLSVVKVRHLPVDTANARHSIVATVHHIGLQAPRVISTQARRDRKGKTAQINVV